MPDIIDHSSRSKELVPMASPTLYGMRSRAALHRANASSDSPFITLASVANALRQWWKVATPAGLLLAAIAASLVYWLFVPVYEASAWLQIDEQAPYIAFESRDRPDVFVSNQIELIRSPLVLGPVVSQPEIARMPDIAKEPSPVEWLASKISVTPVGHSEFFRISFQDPNPKHAELIVRAVTDAYFELRGRNDAKRTQKVIDLLEQERGHRASEVARLRESVRELTKQATGKDPFGARANSDTTTPHPLADLQNRLVNAEVERAILEARIAASEQAASAETIPVPEGMLEQSVQENAEVQRLKDMLVAKRALLHEIEKKSAKGKDDPSFQRLNTEIGHDEETLAKVESQLREELKKDMLATAANRQKDQIQAMKSSLENFRVMEKLLRERYEGQLKDVKLYSGDTLELEFMRDELVRAEGVYDLITERTMKLRTEQRAPTRVSLLRQAEVPAVPIELIPYDKIALASLFCFCLPFGVAIFGERLVQRVVNADSLGNLANLPIVAEVASLPRGPRVSHSNSSQSSGRDFSVFEESIDSLRTCLILSEALKQMKVLAVTSATNNEGKTSVAVQLAVSIARASGARTLLIDGDMRSPDIHTVFGVRQKPGLGEVLGNESSWEESVITSWSDYVHLLPAGRTRGNPHKLLGNGALKQLLDEARKSYRYVLIDTPPVLAASESLVMAKHADATLICAMRDVSRVDQVKKTYDRLSGTGASPVGVVLNGIPRKLYSRRYGSYGYLEG